MEFSFGTLEINRTHQNHLGNGIVNPVNKVSNVTSNVRSSEVGAVEGKKSFQSYLMEAVNKMNDLQMNEVNIQKQVIMDPDSVDVHDVTTAMAKAKMSLDLAQTVIDRLVSGWTELSQNR